MNKETLISVISKMIDCGQMSTQAVQALSSLGYVEAKGVVEICVRNGLAKRDGDKLVPNVSFEEFITLVEKNELDIDLHFFDAYSLMLEHNDLKCPDGVHFLPEGYHVLGTAIAERVLEVINNKNDKGE